MRCFSFEPASRCLRRSYLDLCVPRQPLPWESRQRTKNCQACLRGKLLQQCFSTFATRFVVQLQPLLSSARRGTGFHSAAGHEPPRLYMNCACFTDVGSWRRCATPWREHPNLLSASQHTERQAARRPGAGQDRDHHKPQSDPRAPDDGRYRTFGGLVSLGGFIATGTGVGLSPSPPMPSLSLSHVLCQMTV